MILDRFSQRRKMRLEKAHPMQPRTIALDVACSRRIFYVDKIKLASKLSVILEMALESVIFRQKVPSLNYIKSYY